MCDFLVNVLQMMLYEVSAIGNENEIFEYDNKLLLFNDVTFYKSNKTCFTCCWRIWIIKIHFRNPITDQQNCAGNLSLFSTRLFLLASKVVLRAFKHKLLNGEESPFPKVLGFHGRLLAGLMTGGLLLIVWRQIF